MRKSFLFLLALMAVLRPAPSCAEALDDDSIRALYAEALSVGRDPDQTLAIMKARFDEGFVLKVTKSLHMGDDLLPSSEETKTKSQVLEDTAKGFKMMQIQDLSNQILNITYSDDQQFAYVQDVSASSGTIQVPTANNQTLPFRYSARDVCLDTLRFDGVALKIVRSECHDEMILDPQQAGR